VFLADGRQRAEGLPAGKALARAGKRLGKQSERGEYRRNRPGAVILKPVTVRIATTALPAAVSISATAAAASARSTVSVICTAVISAAPTISAGCWGWAAHVSGCVRVGVISPVVTSPAPITIAPATHRSSIPIAAATATIPIAPGTTPTPAAPAATTISATAIRSWATGVPEPVIVPVAVPAVAADAARPAIAGSRGAALFVSTIVRPLDSHLIA
jgi:hypothetical protein